MPLHDPRAHGCCKSTAAVRCQLLGPALEQNNKLLWLSLAHNGIQSTGAQVMGASLRVNQTLEYISLAGNHVGGPGGRALLRAAEGSQKSVDLSGCDITLEVRTIEQT